MKKDSGSMIHYSPLSALSKVISYGKIEQTRGRLVGFFSSNSFSHKAIMIKSHHHPHHINATLHGTAMNWQKSL